MIKHLENIEQFKEIVKNDKNVLVDFFATWCGPCRMMGRVFEELEDEYKDITILKVDTDDFGFIASQFGVISIPTMVAFKDGERVYFEVNGKQEECLIGALAGPAFKEILNTTFRK